MPGLEELGQGLQRIALAARAVDQHGIQHVEGDVAAKSRRPPIVARGHGMGLAPERRGQSGDDDQRVEMAGVIGEIDALAALRRLPSQRAWAPTSRWTRPRSKARASAVIGPRGRGRWKGSASRR